MLAREEVNGIEGEGIHTLAMVSKYQLFETANYPLFRLIHDIVQQSHDVNKKINTYISKNI